jgi:hypothetical protein
MRLLAVLLTTAGALWADGMIVTPTGVPAYEYGQVAVIRQLAGREELTIATSFATEADDLAWLVPVPAEPEVDSAIAGVFHELELHTRPYYRRMPSFSCMGSAGPDYGRSADSTGLREVSGGVIGDYEYVVLQAFQPETLQNYLLNAGYQLPEGVGSVFQHYLEQGWNYFFIARFHDTTMHYHRQNFGLKLTFDSDSLVYPLYVSRVSSEFEYEQPVVLYVLAEHRQMFRGGHLKFSGAVDQNTFPGLRGFIDRPYRLTKLAKVYRPAEMQDIVLHQATTDEDFRDIEMTSGSPMPLLALAGVLLLRRRRKN